MTPPAIETEKPEETPIVTSKIIPQGLTDFKTPCSAPEAYDREAEENGTEWYPPAKYRNYLPTWENEEMSVA